MSEIREKYLRYKQACNCNKRDHPIFNRFIDENRFSYDLMDKFEVGVTPVNIEGEFNIKDAIVFPFYYYEAGKLVLNHFEFKVMGEDAKTRYSRSPGIEKRASFFGKITDVEKPVMFFTEGCKDALSLYSLGFENVLSLSANVEVDAAFFEAMNYKAQQIFVLYDNDKPGQEMAWNLSMQLDQLGYKVKDLTSELGEYKDISDLYVKGDKAKLDRLNHLVEG
jgi:5S rRNA maturation endonuclease (ribonuclease M5)